MRLESVILLNQWNTVLYCIQTSISLYFAPSILPSILTRCPDPADKMQPYNMMQLPLYFSWHGAFLCGEVGFTPHKLLWIFAKTLYILFSSDHRNFPHCNRATIKLLGKLRTCFHMVPLSNGLFCATLPYRLVSERLICLTGAPSLCSQLLNSVAPSKWSLAPQRFLSHVPFLFTQGRLFFLSRQLGCLICLIIEQQHPLGHPTVGYCWVAFS